VLLCCHVDHRELLLELPAEGFYSTGIHTDVVQVRERVYTDVVQVRERGDIVKSNIGQDSTPSDLLPFPLPAYTGAPNPGSPNSVS